MKSFTAKGIEKALARVNDTLYASAFEVSNGEYNQFLEAIAKKDSFLYTRYQVDSIRWMENAYNNEPLVEYYHRHVGFSDYPVVCVTYESALAYCEWLTDIYNNMLERKFKKVIFTLPTEQEWELAARGNNPNSIFPWGTHSMRDTREGSWQGAFLANFKRGVGKIVTGPDGKPVITGKVEPSGVAGGLNDRAFYTAAVNTFFPNNLGIYNQSGNAAEMTLQKGLTKGGSWNSFGGELRIAYRLFFPEPSPEVGFRVFMKIVEK